jgi:hypothetical protein
VQQYMLVGEYGLLNGGKRQTSMHAVTVTPL